MKKESEQEDVIFHDEHPETGFILLPDSKWDRIQPSQLYLLAISQSPAIKSLRDLRGSHLCFLKGMRSGILKCIKEKWGLGWRDVRLLIHYQPSYYHFHVHVINIAVEGMYIVAVFMTASILLMIIYSSHFNPRIGRNCCGPVSFAWRRYWKSGMLWRLLCDTQFGVFALLLSPSLWRSCWWNWIKDTL